MAEPMADAPLIITPEVRAQLQKLRALAARQPTDIIDVMRLIKTPRGKQQHKERMTAQSIRIPGPWDFIVTFSLETGHPAGTCRHMSMSIMREGRVPHPTGLLLVAEDLGFSGDMEACLVWTEDLSDGGKAINMLQPINAQQSSRA
jgi:hypothetical protein